MSVDNSIDNTGEYKRNKRFKAAILENVTDVYNPGNNLNFDEIHDYDKQNASTYAEDVKKVNDVINNEFLELYVDASKTNEDMEHDYIFPYKKVAHEPLVTGFHHVFFTCPIMNIMVLDKFASEQAARNTIKYYGEIVNNCRVLGIKRFSMGNSIGGSDSIYDDWMVDYLSGKIRMSKFATPFIPFLSNRCVSVPSSEVNMGTREYGTSISKFSMSIGTDTKESRMAGDITVEYAEDSDLSIMRFHKLWMEYIEGLSEGDIYPNIFKTTIYEQISRFISSGGTANSNPDLVIKGIKGLKGVSSWMDKATSKVSSWLSPKDQRFSTTESGYITDGGFFNNLSLDYLSSIYYFHVKPDGHTLNYWCKYTGVYPTSIPYDIFSVSEGQQQVVDKVGIKYKSLWKEEMNIEILRDFNLVACANQDFGTYPENGSEDKRKFLGLYSGVNSTISTIHNLPNDSFLYNVESKLEKWTELYGGKNTNFRTNSFYTIANPVYNNSLYISTRYNDKSKKTDFLLNINTIDDEKAKVMGVL